MYHFFKFTRVAWADLLPCMRAQNNSADSLHCQVG